MELTKHGHACVALGDGDRRLVIDPGAFTDPSVLEEFDGRLDPEAGGRGMQFEALAAERLVREGNLAGDILPLAESVAIMGTLDEIRRQIGVRYPGESTGEQA